MKNANTYAESIGSRIKSRRKELELSQMDVATKVGLKSSSSISQWESGATSPTGVHLHLLAMALETSKDWILTGTFQVGEPLQGEHSYTRVVRIPLLPNDQGRYESGEDKEWIVTTYNVSDEAFAVRHSGQAMVRANESRSIPDGAIAIIDPTLEPGPNDIVLASVGENEALTIRLLQHEGGTRYLMPLNESFQAIVLSKTDRILGVVVAAQLDIQRR